MLISRVAVRLVLASALMLVVELALIRWLGANVLHLSYFSNIVLLGSFLGIGLGFLRARQRARPPWFFPPALALLVVVVLNAELGVDRSNSDLIFFSSLATSGPPPWVVLPVVFVAVAAVLFGPGYLVGQCFFELPRLTAYRLDLIGSLAGIVGFTVLSFLGAPSTAWGIVVAVLTLLLYLPARYEPAAATFPRAPRWALALAGASVGLLVGALAVESSQPGVRWSPYYKIETQTAQTTIGEFTTVIANGVPHQAVTEVGARVDFEPFYLVPYQRSARTDPGRVLIVGAGTGTDVALALREGATSVDAVEIDPRIREIGQVENPNRPFDDPRVTVHITDGRAFIERTDKQFDTILFALPDSLTLVAGASQLRLESYLFTEPAMQRVRDLLADDGVFAMYNYYREPWLVGRLGATMQAAFGHAPCMDLNRDYNSAVLVASADPAQQRCGPDDESTSLLAGAPAPVDDNRPFLYLRTPHIPGFYLAVLAMILGISLLSVRAAVGSLRRTRRYADLFLLGAAFLLLETRAITMFALLFGTTWLVNAIVFGGILVAVLAAVEFTAWLKRRDMVDRISLPVAYAVLLVGIAIAWLVPLESLLALPVGLRVVVATAITFLPVFTANVVFASRFDRATEPSVAFGVNLLGAMLGGALEYLALVIGYRELLLVAALLYVGALVIGARDGARAGAGATAGAAAGG
jgi:SAM-dependent methyltransferase